jgi:hypothetical protein
MTSASARSFRGTGLPGVEAGDVGSVGAGAPWSSAATAAFPSRGAPGLVEPLVTEAELHADARFAGRSPRVRMAAAFRVPGGTWRRW